MGAVKSDISEVFSPGTAAMPCSAGGVVGPVTSTVLAIMRLMVLAATEAFQGPVLATVPGLGPLLPAEAETKIPALVAFRKA